MPATSIRPNGATVSVPVCPVHGACHVEVEPHDGAVLVTEHDCPECTASALRFQLLSEWDGRETAGESMLAFAVAFVVSAAAWLLYVVFG